MPIIHFSIWERGGREFNAAGEGQAAGHKHVARQWHVQRQGWAGSHVACSWRAEISVNSYSNMNYLLSFAKEAILLIVRDHGLFFSHISPCFLPAPASRITHCPHWEDFNHHLAHPLDGINKKKKAQWNQFPGPPSYNEGRVRVGTWDIPRQPYLLCSGLRGRMRS